MPFKTVLFVSIVFVAKRKMPFLFVITGSNVIVGREINVRFVVQSDFQRRPIPHTCGCILEISYDFQNYMDFRSEFNKVLDSNVWVMDIV